MSSRLLYYLLLKPLSYLPLGILYGVSDFMYVMLYKIFKYRQKVVRTNLVNSFPEKTTEEIAKIEREFYSHFCDIIVESVRLFSIGESELRQRNKMLNPEVMDDLYNEGKSVILVGGHYNNWETGAAILSRYVKHHIVGIYAPLSNQFFNTEILKSRERFGMEMLSKKIVKAGFEKNKEKLTATIFATDQSPTHSKTVHWTTFLNQPTAVLFGSELYAKEYNFPVVYIYVTKVKRGYYEMEAKLLEKNPAQTVEGYITETHTRWLENQILANPQFWLWTHKRWKRKWKDGDKMYSPNNG